MLLTNSFESQFTQSYVPHQDTNVKTSFLHIKAIELSTKIAPSKLKWIEVSKLYG